MLHAVDGLYIEIEPEEEPTGGLLTRRRGRRRSPSAGRSGWTLRPAAAPTPAAVPVRWRQYEAARPWRLARQFVNSTRRTRGRVCIIKRPRNR